MKFTLTPGEAWPVAEAIAKLFRKRRAKIKVETALANGAPYRTTLVVFEHGKAILIETQGTLTYGRTLQELASWLSSRREYCELFLATSSEGSIPVGLLSQLQHDGVGLMIVDDDGVVKIEKAPRNPALVVTPDPTLAYGECKKAVTSAVEKFNNVDRKDGLRDMCELVEQETERLIRKAVNKGIINIPVASIDQKDWSDQINALASTQAHGNKSATLSENLKNDMHSFRGARNLIDHKVKTKREDKKRQRQFAERMVQGPRLVAELVALRRKIK